MVGASQNPIEMLARASNAPFPVIGKCHVGCGTCKIARGKVRRFEFRNHLEQADEADENEQGGHKRAPEIAQP